MKKLNSEISRIVIENPRDKIDLHEDTIRTIYEVYDESLLKYKLNKATLIEEESWEQEMYPEDMTVNGQ